MSSLVTPFEAAVEGSNVPASESSNPPDLFTSSIISDLNTVTQIGRNSGTKNWKADEHIRLLEAVVEKNSFNAGPTDKVWLKVVEAHGNNREPGPTAKHFRDMISKLRSFQSDASVSNLIWPKQSENAERSTEALEQCRQAYAEEAYRKMVTSGKYGTSSWWSVEAIFRYCIAIENSDSAKNTANVQTADYLRGMENERKGKFEQERLATQELIKKRKAEEEEARELD